MTATASRDSHLLCATLLAMAGLLGCSGSVTDGVAVAVQPPAIQVPTGRTANFAAVVTGTANTAVIWSIQEGSPAGGSITSAGLYTAPPSAGTYHVIAQSQADSSKSGTATVTIVTTMPLPASAQACATEPINSTGHTVYYACDCQAGADPSCVPGNDSNNGTSPSTPFQTYSKLRGTFSSLRAGDTVAFCQGGSFANSNDSWGNSNCTASSPCTIRDYVDPRWTAAVPGQRPLLTSGAGARAITMTGANQHGFRILNLKFQAAAPGGDCWAGAGPGTGPTTDILLCNIHCDNFYGGTEFYRAAERVSIIGSRFTNMTRWGVFGGSSGLVIKDSYFDNNGYNYSPANQGHGGIYINASSDNDPTRYPGPLTNVTITGNTMTNNSIQNGVCQAAPLVMHGYADGVLIENNYIDGRGPGGAIQNGSYTNGGCYGIMISLGYTSACGFHNVTVRRNRLFYTGYEGISLSECDTCTVEDNEIVMRPGGSGIYMPFDYHRSQDFYYNTAVTVRNNTIYFGNVYPAQTGNVGVYIGSEGNNYVVASNAIQYDGTSSSGFDCFTIDSPGTRVAAMDHNSCYRPSASSSSWAQVGSTSYSRASWTSAFGFDANSQESNPLFTSLTEPWNFTPCLSGDPGCSGTSPLIGAADPVNYSPIAISGPTWTAGDPGKPRDANPDIGAYER